MSLNLLVDENFNNNIVRALLRRDPDLDVVRVQDVGLSATDNRHILEWAAQQQRILLTHDVTTVTKYADERVKQGLPMSGVFEVKRATTQWPRD